MTELSRTDQRESEQLNEVFLVLVWYQNCNVGIYDYTYTVLRSEGFKYQQKPLNNATDSHLPLSLLLQTCHFLTLSQVNGSPVSQHCMDRY